MQIKCTHCNGTGSLGVINIDTCPYCKGVGKVNVNDILINMNKYLGELYSREVKSQE